MNRLSLAQLWFASWCSVPRSQRFPRSYAGAAKVLGVKSRTTLYAWRRNADLIAVVRELGRRLGEVHYGEVFGAVVREAVAGSVAHARLYFELLGELKGAGGEVDSGRVPAGANFFFGPTVVDERKVDVVSDPFAQFLQGQRGAGQPPVTE